MEVIIGNIDWAALCNSGLLVEASKNQVEFSGCDWVSSESILECLNTNHVEDVTVPQSITSHHAARVASLVQIIQNGGTINRIRLKVKSSKLGIKVLIYDGSHRIRAYQYLDKLNSIGVVVIGLVSEIEKFVVK